MDTIKAKKAETKKTKKLNLRNTESSKFKV